MGTLLVIALLTFAIIIHELGHMLVAKMMGVKVSEFSVGFGPKLFTWKYGETDYCICLLPFGGYVKMKGMEKDVPHPDDGDHLQCPDDSQIVPHNCQCLDVFANKRPWQKFCILIGGVSANIIFAFVFFLIANLSGYQVYTNKVTPIKDYPAVQSGLQEGDRIVEINSVKTKDLIDIQMAIKDTRGEPLKVKAERNGVTLTFIIVPKYVDGNYIIGIKSCGETRTENLGVVKSVKLAGQNTVVLPLKFAHGLYMTFTGKVKVDELAGPVGIVHIGGLIYSKRSMYDFLFFCGLLMAALFFFNILPLPILDGGHILYLAIEKIRGRPVSLVTKHWAAIVFLVILVVFSLYVCQNDIRRIGSGFQLK